VRVVKPVSFRIKSVKVTKPLPTGRQAFRLLIFPRLLKKGPACAEASAGRQMQVELCEIPPLREPLKDEGWRRDE
jgi:hypothetical protein